jgi:hypothetical protein
VRVWDPYSDLEAVFQWSPGAHVKTPGASLPPKGWIAYSAVSRAAVSRSDDGMLHLHQNLGQQEQVTALGVAATSAAFSHTGRFLAAGVPSSAAPDERGAPGHSVVVWDLHDRSRPTRMEWGASATRASAGDRWAASQSARLVELHQAAEPPGEPVLLEAADSHELPALSFGSNGTYLAVVSKPSTRFNVSRTIRLHAASTAAVAGEVCTRVRRNLTQDEWRRFIGPAVPYERTCPDLPAGR